MQSDKAPCNAAGRVEFPPSVTSCLRDQRDHVAPLLGGVLSGSQLSWLSKGPVLEVLRTCDGSKIAAWTFGAVVRDFKTKITCVRELPHSSSFQSVGQINQLLVGLECELTGGMLCVFNIAGSRVLRAINIPSKVTAMDVVSLAGGSLGPLHQCFESMSGIAVVGTNDGQILLVNLRRSDCDNALHSGPKTHWDGLRDELQSCGLIPLKNASPSVVEEYPDDHTYLHINERYFLRHQRLVVQLSAKDGNAFLPEDPSVTSLLYIPQLASLCVGFAFGSFQIWSLQNLSLTYTLPRNEPCPVVQLSFQEACDDPNAYCYLWAVRGGSSLNNVDGDLDRPVTVFGPPRATMFSLCYDEKVTIPEYGLFYKNFMMCSTAFEYDLSGQDDSVGGRLISLYSVSQGMLGPGAVQPNSEDSSSLGASANAISLNVVVWETWGPTGPSSSVDPVRTHMSLFDVNQWYVDQMPSRMSQRGGPSRNKSIASYIVSYNLADAISTSGGTLLDIKVDQNTLIQFSSVQNAEEYSRPSSLSFNSEVLMERQIVHLKHPGVQRALLSNLLLTGPSALMTPTTLFHECLALGLRPLLMDLSNAANVPVDEQRAFVLCVALEQHMGRFVSRCAREWADGRLSAAGCTLSWLLSVAWNRAAILKQLAIRICTQLFDHSGEKLDSNAQRQLHHIVRMYHLLEVLFENVVHNKWHLALNEGPQVSLQNDALKLECQYYSVLQWLIDVELLPEGPNAMVPYPAQEIAEFYHSRRCELKQLLHQHAEEEQTEDILMVDSLLRRQLGGFNVLSEWERDAAGGTSLDGASYPPISLQALLRTFLIKDVSLIVKNSIVIYLLMDLANVLDNVHYQKTLRNFMRYPAAFSVPVGWMRLTQAFWHLDNKAFDTALDMLLDPLISGQDIEPWQHRAIIRLLAVQGQAKLALRYVRVRRPPLQDQSDIRLHLTLLIANDFIDEAFTYQRSHRTESNAEHLLTQFFQGCEERNQLKTVLRFCFDDEEEVAFSKYLGSSRHPASDDLRVVYLLKRSRYVEALEVNQDLKKKGGGTGSTRDIVVNGFYKTLPSVTRKLASHCAQQQHKLKSWNQVTKSSPLFVNPKIISPQMRYKSSLLEAAVEKSRETWAKFVDRIPPVKSEVEATPFLCTPRAKRPYHPRRPDVSIHSSAQKAVDRKRGREDDTNDDSYFNLKRSRFQKLESTLAELQQHKSVPPRYSISSSLDAQPSLLTPIVQRRSPSSRAKLQQQMIASSPGHSSLTPQSIIKVRSAAGSSKPPCTVRLVSNEPELTEEESESEHFSVSTIKPRKGESETDSDLDENEKDEDLVSAGVSARRLIDFESDISSDLSTSQTSVDTLGTSISAKSPHSGIAAEKSLSKMVVLSEARKAGKPVHSVTFGKGSICVYDQDEPVDAEVSVQDESSNDTEDQEASQDEAIEDISENKEDENSHITDLESPKESDFQTDRKFRPHRFDTSGLGTLSSSEIETGLSCTDDSEVFHSADSSAQETMTSVTFRRSLARPSLKEITKGLTNLKRTQISDENDGAELESPALTTKGTPVHGLKSEQVGFVQQDDYVEKTTVFVSREITNQEEVINGGRSSVTFTKSREIHESSSSLARPSIKSLAHINAAGSVDSPKGDSSIKEGSDVGELFSAESEFLDRSYVNEEGEVNLSGQGWTDNQSKAPSLALLNDSCKQNQVQPEANNRQCLVSVDIVDLDDSSDEESEEEEEIVEKDSSPTPSEEDIAEKDSSPTPSEEEIAEKDSSPTPSEEDITEDGGLITENSNIFMNSRTDHSDSSSDSSKSLPHSKHEAEDESFANKLHPETNEDEQGEGIAVAEEVDMYSPEHQPSNSVSNPNMAVISEEAGNSACDLGEISTDNADSQEVPSSQSSSKGLDVKEISIFESEEIVIEQDDMPTLRLDAGNSPEKLSERQAIECDDKVLQHDSRSSHVKQLDADLSLKVSTGSSNILEEVLELPVNADPTEETRAADATCPAIPCVLNEELPPVASKRRTGTRRSSVSSVLSETHEEETSSRRVTRSQLKYQSKGDSAGVAQPSEVPGLVDDIDSSSVKASSVKDFNELHEIPQDKDKQARKRNLSTSSIGIETATNKEKSSAIPSLEYEVKVDAGPQHLDVLEAISEGLPASKAVKNDKQKPESSEVSAETSVIESYETSRRLTRHQRALLARSMEIRPVTPSIRTKLQSRKEEAGEEVSDDDRMSVSSVRSSLRLRAKRQEDTAHDSPNSTASTVLNPALTPTTRSRRRRQSSSDVSEINRDTSPVSSMRRQKLPGTPTSLRSTPTRQSARLSALRSEDGDNQSVASLSPSSVASGRRSNTKRSARRLSLSSETSEQYAFASPQVEHGNTNENYDAEVTEPFVFSPPKTIATPSKAKVSSTNSGASSSRKSTRQSRASVLPAIKEESSSRISTEDSQVGKSEPSSSHQQSWHFIEPPVGKELTGPAEKRKRASRKPSVDEPRGLHSAYPLRKKFSVEPIPQSSDSESDSEHSAKEKDAVKPRRASRQAPEDSPQVGNSEPSSSHQQSWHFIEPPVGKELTGPAEKRKRASRKPSVDEPQGLHSAYPLRKKFSVEPIPQSLDSESDSDHSAKEKDAVKPRRASRQATASHKKRKT